MGGYSQWGRRLAGPDANASDREGVVRVGSMVNIAPTLARLGADPESVFEHAGQSVTAFSDPEHRVTYGRGGRLLAECVAETGCDHFGLLVGQSSEPSHLGLAGFLARAAPTVGEALSALVEYLDLHDEGGTLELAQGGDYCRLSFHVHQPGVMAIDQVYDLCAAIMRNIMRALCGPTWLATEVLLPRRRPADSSPFRRFFGTVVLFDSDVCAISFPSRWLTCASLTADALLFRHLEKEAIALHKLNLQEITDALPGVIQRGLITDDYSASDIARRLGLRERTFHRRLQAAGTSFRQELDRVRKSVSLQLLESTSLPVCEIAQSLGYSDSSCFIRAFQRWSGCSPSAWRKRQGAHPHQLATASRTTQSGLFPPLH